MIHTFNVLASLSATSSRTECTDGTLSASFHATVTWPEFLCTKDMHLCRWIEKGVPTRPSTMKITKCSWDPGFVSLRMVGSGVFDEPSRLFASCFPFHADVEFSQAALKAGAKCNTKHLCTTTFLCVHVFSHLSSQLTTTATFSFLCFYQLSALLFLKFLLNGQQPMTLLQGLKEHHRYHHHHHRPILVNLWLYLRLRGREKSASLESFKWRENFRT